ncbi:alpha/beta hydrolase [Rhodohalobacter sp.]|uniref:alpha/beta hydrolase n=1 Tax=Rhodohalobacter sp. TaxID=1974210 RepID=UPI002ACEDB06|nr:alpha/beta hydrolase [Rhodohalobacter sp.]MDZ7756517.1 alpha/beta hydrolase [Rhodohalobacter sp.]
MKACQFIIILAALIFISCENNDDLVLDNQLELTYSYSPISLGDIDAKFSEDISYGPYSRNTFDIFLPESDRPTPLVIYIHGGGFISGSKDIVYEPMWSGSWDFPEEIRTLLKNDIAFASINYRLLEFEDDPDGVLKSLNDSKRGLQFIKSYSEAFNIDKNNIILTGSSAGAGTSLWLGFSDDMADLSNEDKVLRESTRVKAMAVKATQATYDLEKFQSLIFAEYNFKWMDYFELDPDMFHRFKSFYGMSSLNEFNTEEIRNYRRKVDMLLMMTEDDPEFWVANLQKPVVAPTQNTIVTHHAYHAKTLRTWADSIGIANVAYYGDYEDPNDESFIDFLLRKALE